MAHVGLYPDLRSDTQIFPHRAAPTFNFASIEIGFASNKCRTQAIGNAKPQPLFLAQIAASTEGENATEVFGQGECDCTSDSSTARETGDIGSIRIERNLAANALFIEDHELTTPCTFQSDGVTQSLHNIIVIVQGHDRRRQARDSIFVQID